MVKFCGKHKIQKDPGKNSRRIETAMSWTQPLCDRCWKFISGGKRPFRLKEREVEQCCRCGGRADGGIYVRVDPATVAYPQGQK